MMYNLAYMDNVACSSLKKDDVIQAYVSSKDMFSRYKNKLQKKKTPKSVPNQNRTLTMKLRKQTYSACNGIR